MENQQSDIIFYSSPAGHVKVEVIFNDETFWLNQKRLAELFAVDVNTINYHLKEIFKSQELSEEATIRKIRIVQKEGNYAKNQAARQIPIKMNDVKSSHRFAPADLSTRGPSCKRPLHFRLFRSPDASEIG
jgi:hypothetical protein